MFKLKVTSCTTTDTGNILYITADSEEDVELDPTTFSVLYRDQTIKLVGGYRDHEDYTITVLNLSGEQPSLPAKEITVTCVLVEESASENSKEFKTVSCGELVEVDHKDNSVFWRETWYNLVKMTKTDNVIFNMPVYTLIVKS